MHITLKQLEVFRVVAKQMSFTKAAKLLNMTQPAVSTQIKNLEQQLDLKLFEYISKKLIPTDAGREITKRVHELHDTLEIFKQHVSHIKGLLAGKLVISAPYDAQKPLLFLAKTFQEKYPHIQLHFRNLTRNRQIQLLHNHTLDFCVMDVPPKKNSFHTETLFLNEYVVIAPINHPLTQKSALSLEKMGGICLILPERYSHARSITEEKFKKNQTTFIRLYNKLIAKDAVEAGLGLAIVPKTMLHPELYGKCYTPLDVVGFPVLRPTHLVYRHESLLSPAALAFKQFALTHGNHP